MNGIHDVGGMHGFGPIEIDPAEPLFHHPWEKTVFGMRLVVVAEGLFNIDEFRHAIERIAPAAYLTASYYERWLVAVATLLGEKGVLPAAELEAKTRALSRSPRPKRPRRSDPELVARMRAVVRTGRRYTREGGAPRFNVGDAVVARNLNPPGHTRLPRYARGKRGVVTRVWGTFVTPDTNAHGRGENPEPVYCVRFTGGELWGGDCEPNQAVYLSLWEQYLQPV